MFSGDCYPATQKSEMTYLQQIASLVQGMFYYSFNQQEIQMPHTQHIRKDCQHIHYFGNIFMFIKYNS